MAKELTPFQFACCELYREITRPMNYDDFCRWYQMEQYLTAQYDDTEPVSIEDIRDALKNLPPIAAALLGTEIKPGIWQVIDD